LSSILLLSQDKSKSLMLQTDLSPSGHTCLQIEGTEGLARLLTRKPDMAIVDASTFPSDNDVWQWLMPEPEAKSLAILLLIPENRLREWQLDRYCDDFLIDPYRKLELLSRVSLLLKRSGTIEASVTIRRVELVIDDSGYEVKVGGQRIDLTYREYQLLRYLALKPGRVVTRDNLLNGVWGYDYLGGDRTIDVHIRRLRSKLEDANHVFIETVRNMGYRFKEQPVEFERPNSSINNNETKQG
jgi:two-component system alkaline phosphatase synthesis response regulator PhoP